MSDEKLRNCPFCGGEAEIAHGSRGDGTPWEYVACSICESGAPHAINVGDSAKKWNSRTITEAEFNIAVSNANRALNLEYEKTFIGPVVYVDTMKVILKAALSALGITVKE